MLVASGLDCWDAPFRVVLEAWSMEEAVEICILSDSPAKKCQEVFSEFRTVAQRL